jgi:hypothetical protein
MVDIIHGAMSLSIGSFADIISLKAFNFQHFYDIIQDVEK